MARFIVLVIDSYGIGAMDDLDNRPYDKKANTSLHVFEKNAHLKLPTLEKLGLGNIVKSSYLKETPNTSFGTSLLKHWGADTFLGHQEILGTLPLPPVIQAFSKEINKIEKILIEHNYSVRRYGNNLSILVVNEAATIGDNLETDLGQNYNITSAFDLMPYKETCKLAEIVRYYVYCNRIIAFGAPNIHFKKILNAYEEINNTYAGISAPKSGVYKEGYLVRHLGYGVDHKKQVQFILGEQGIPSYLIGKVADIADNHTLGESYGEIVDSNSIFDIAVNCISKQDNGFFCINIQETDLAGHMEDYKRYGEILTIVDNRLNDILKLMNEDDIIIVTADHGNDPTIGHSKHTREKVPILIEGKHYKNIRIGERSSLSDIAASACSFFHSNVFPPNGESFL